MRIRGIFAALVVLAVGCGGARKPAGNSGDNTPSQTGNGGSQVKRLGLQADGSLSFEKAVR